MELMTISTKYSDSRNAIDVIRSPHQYPAICLL